MRTGIYAATPGSIAKESPTRLERCYQGCRFRYQMQIPALFPLRNPRFQCFFIKDGDVVVIIITVAVTSGASSATLVSCGFGLVLPLWPVTICPLRHQQSSFELILFEQPQQLFRCRLLHFSCSQVSSSSTSVLIVASWYGDKQLLCFARASLPLFSRHGAQPSNFFWLGIQRIQPAQTFSNACAVFSPTPGTPGMLSEGHPSAPGNR